MTTVRPGKPVDVELSFRNITTCDVKVYRIDLIKFGLLRQDMAGIGRINLAGIDPQQESIITLADNKDYRDHSRKLNLALEDEGAYLVVCRGGNLFASGLVLISPLDVEVQYDGASGEVRATVKDVTKDRYVYQADVKVISVGNADIVSGQTDRRGLYVAHDITGSPAVIVRLGTAQYALQRSAAVAMMDMGHENSRTMGISIPPSAAPMIATTAASTRQPGSLVGVVIAGPGASLAEQRIEAALSTLTSLSFRNLPLQDVATAIQQRHGLTVRLDRRALDDVGLSAKTAVTFEGRGLTLRSALRLILR